MLILTTNHTGSTHYCRTMVLLLLHSRLSHHYGLSLNDKLWSLVLIVRNDDPIGIHLM